MVRLPVSYPSRSHFFLFYASQYMSGGTLFEGYLTLSYLLFVKQTIFFWLVAASSALLSVSVLHCSCRYFYSSQKSIVLHTANTSLSLVPETIFPYVDKRFYCWIGWLWRSWHCILAKAVVHVHHRCFGPLAIWRQWFSYMGAVDPWSFHVLYSSQ